MTFPNHGTINAFVIFVQPADEPDDAGDFGSDPATEWPFDHGQPPAWTEQGGLLAPPGTAPDAYTDGSLSAFYHLMSRGRFSLTGAIYPTIYVPQQPIDWYHANRGDFPTGAAALSHEILTSPQIRTYFADNPDRLDFADFDRYQNGTNLLEPDGVFDMIVLVYRGVFLSRLRLDRFERPIGGSSISSLGADVAFRPDHLVDYQDPATDAFAGAPVTLGGLRVIDNVVGGSGIITQALSQKQAVRIIAHELGHRHFGPYHSCQGPASPTSDCLGIMGGAYITMSAPDRIKLGWAEVIPVDVPALGRIDLTIPDALASGQVFRLREPGQDSCGDVIIEARFWSNYWDSPPNPADPNALFFGNDDGDQNDLFLPQEGLYLYKAPAPGDVFCGGNNNPAFDYQLYSSLENNGLFTRLTPFRRGASNDLQAFRVDGSYQVAYEPGHIYAPFARPRFFWHENPSLDRRLSITNIEREGEEAFTVEIWTDYLAGLPEEERLLIDAYPNPMAGRTTLRYEVTREAHLRLDLFDTTGRHIAHLADGRHQPGIHEIRLDTEQYAAGIYFVRLHTEGRSRTQALQVIE